MPFTVKTLSCSVAQPVCNGKKSNAFKKTGKSTSLNDTKTPTNAASEGTTKPSSSNDKTADKTTSSAFTTHAAGVAVSVLAITVALVL